MRAILLVLVGLLSSVAQACLWDYDTLETEVKGMPGVLEVIAGRFPRNPPLYYEMRLARVAKEVQTQPQKLELYDDAGVACDRLHKGDEAIAWMAKKRVQLDRLGFNAQSKEHWYRYHANLGTFQAHRWLRAGANRKNIGEMKTARDNIKRAIQINPDAHFGREKYQLMAMEWIIEAPRYKPNDVHNTFLKFSDNDAFKARDNALSGKKPSEASAKAVEGLSGLIVLGDAWHSVDVFYALKIALILHHDSALAALADRRLSELRKSGNYSLQSGAPRDSNQADIQAL